MFFLPWEIMQYQFYLWQVKDLHFMFYSHIKQKAVYTFYFPQPFLDLSQKWFSIVEVLVVADRLTWLCVVDEGAEDEEGEQGSQEKIFPACHGSVVCRSGAVVVSLNGVKCLKAESVRVRQRLLRSVLKYRVSGVFPW